MKFKNLENVNYTVEFERKSLFLIDDNDILNINIEKNEFVINIERNNNNDNINDTNNDTDTDIYNDINSDTSSDISENINNDIDSDKIINNIILMKYSKIDDQNLYSEEIHFDNKNNYYYDYKKKIINSTFYYYYEVKSFSESITFNSFFLELNDAKGIKENRTTNVSELFGIKGYLVNKTLLNNEDQLRELKPYIGHYDLTYRQGYIIFQNEEINNYKNNNNESLYILIKINQESINQRTYKNIHNIITVFKSNNNEINNTIPSNIYLTNILSKNEMHKYILDCFLDEEEYIFIDFSSTNDKKIKVKIYELENNGGKGKELEKKYIKKQEEIGKNIIRVTKNISPILLTIESIESPKKNIVYTFKYYAEKKNYIFPYKYNNSNTLYKIIRDDLLIITIGKIKINNNNDNNNIEDIKINYYISVYKRNVDSNIKDDEDIILTTLKEENPYLRNKISYDDSILLNATDSFIIETNIPKNEKCFIDITAEIVFKKDTLEYLAYKRIVPKTRENNLYFIIFGVSGVILILIIFLIFCIYCYKKKNQELIKTVDKISFVIGDSKESNNNLDETMTSESYDKDSEDGPDPY